MRLGARQATLFAAAAGIAVVGVAVVIQRSGPAATSRTVHASAPVKAAAVPQPQVLPPSTTVDVTSTSQLPVTTTSSAPVAHTTVPVTAAKRVTTTAPAPTVPKPSFSIAPSPGPANSMLTVSGTGCDGSSNGVNVYLRGPGSSNPQSDPPAAMSAGQAPEAGPWSLYVHAPLNPGTYTAGASCFDTATGRVLVTYPSKSFTVVAG